MYGYAEHIYLSPEQVLQKVSPEDIFKWILEVDELDLEGRYISTLRDDNKPGCRFETRPDGALVFVDFGEKAFSGHTHRSCFGMVIDKYGVKLDGAIQIICNEFGLSTNQNDYKPVERSIYTREESPSDAIITYDKRMWERRDSLFWSQFLIKQEDLVEDKVYPTNTFYIQKPNKPRKTITVYGICYAIDFIDRVKLYQPYSEDYRFITNCDEDYIGNFDNLPEEGDELIVSKSYKDHRVIRNLLDDPPTIWFPNEGCIPSDWILESMVKRFNLVTIFYDNDSVGMEAAAKVAKRMNYIKFASTRTIFLPKIRKHYDLFGKYLKDPGELVKREGRIDTVKILKQIGL